ncbi:MAG: hypothetical protein ACXW4L_08235 [Candidatus Limnocylindrales bacterium]
MLRRSILALVLVAGGLWVAACTQPAGGAGPDASGAPLDSGGKYGY